MRRVILIVYLIIGLSILGKSELYAQEGRFTALFLTKFTEYIKWPEKTGQHVIGVYKSDEIMNHLASFAEKKANVKVVKLSSPREASRCDLVYLPRSEDGMLASFAEVIGNSSVVLVSQDSKMTSQGADIGFFMKEGKLRFALKESSMSNKQLKVSRSLLVLAEVI